MTVSPIRERARRGRRRLEDRARHHRAGAAAGRGAASTPPNTQKLGEVGAVVASTLDREAIVQKVTDTATELTRRGVRRVLLQRAAIAESGDAYMLYTLSGAPKEAFANFPHPRATAMFAPTFRGEGAVRLDDVTQDPRYGKNAPYFGMPPGHLPVRSYLAVPVKGVSGDVLGGLFFGHSQAGVFTEQHERLAVGVAAWASVALENARLYVEAREAQPDEGRVPRRAVARAAHAAQRHRRLRAAAARRHPAGREGRRAASKRSNATPRG